MIYPLGMNAVPVEFIIQEAMKYNPKAILCIEILEDGTIKFLHSTMDMATRSYLVKVADAVITQEILATTIPAGPLKS